MAKKVAAKAPKAPAKVKVVQKQVQKQVKKQSVLANVKGKVPKVAQALGAVSSPAAMAQAVASKAMGALGGRKAAGVRGFGRRRNPVPQIKRRIKSALYRQARYQVATGQPMRAAKTLRKRFRVI